MRRDSWHRLLTFYRRDTQEDSTSPDIQQGRHVIRGAKARVKRTTKIQIQAHTTTDNTPIGNLNSEPCLGRTGGREREETRSQEDDKCYPARKSHSIPSAIRVTILLPG